MTKEIAICIIIVVLIFVGDMVTQKYTNDTISETSKNLNQIRDKLIKEDTEFKVIKEEITGVHDDWNKKHKKLAYYIEHDELEKVETNLSVLKAYIEIEEFKEAVVELDKTVYILEHIKYKNIFNLENIF